MNRAAGFVILSTLGLLACGGGGDGATVPGVDASTPPIFDDADFGRIEVRSRDFGAGDGDTAISGALYTSPVPWPYDGPQLEGACRMWLLRPADSCVPACSFEQVCDLGFCSDPPRSISAGTLTVEGAGTRIEVPHDQGYQFYDTRSRFAPGTSIMVRAPGDELPGFTVSARLPSPLVLENSDQLELAIGTPLTVRWTPADPDARVRVTMGADLGHARHRSVVVECDVADFDGGVAIPQVMVDELADPANWSCGDCFGHEVRRYRRGDTTIPNFGLPLTFWAVQFKELYLRP